MKLLKHRGFSADLEMEKIREMMSVVDKLRQDLQPPQDVNTQFAQQLVYIFQLKTSINSISIFHGKRVNNTKKDFSCNISWAAMARHFRKLSKKYPIFLSKLGYGPFKRCKLIMQAAFITNKMAKISRYKTQRNLALFLSLYQKN